MRDESTYGNRIVFSVWHVPCLGGLFFFLRRQPKRPPIPVSENRPGPAWIVHVYSTPRDRLRMAKVEGCRG